MFQALTGRIKSEVVGLLSKVQVRAEEDVEAIEARRRRSAPVEAVHAALPQPPEDAAAPAAPVDALGDVDAAMEPLRAAAGGRDGAPDAGGVGIGRARPAAGRARWRGPGPIASRKPIALCPRGPQDRPQRAVSVRLGEEVQAMSWTLEVREAMGCPSG